MIKFLLLFLLPLSILHASKILSYTVYDKSDKSDLIITFDTPYKGIIKQSTSTSKIIIKLNDASIETSKIKQVSSQYLHAITITPMLHQTQIVATVPSSIKVIITKTSDSYALKISFISTDSPQSTNISTPKETNLLASLLTQKSHPFLSEYSMIFLLLIVALFILFFIVKKTTQKESKKNQNPWLFQENEQSKESQKKEKSMRTNANTQTKKVSIRFQKSINAHNSVVILDCGEKSHLVLVGENHIFVEGIMDEAPNTEEDFAFIVASKKQEFDNFSKNDTHILDEYKQGKNTLEAYKERASSILYED